MTPKQQQIYDLLLLAHDRKKGVLITLKSNEIAVNVRAMIYKLRRRIISAKGKDWEKLQAMSISICENTLRLERSDLDVGTLKVIDVETGENITKEVGFDFVDEVVEIDEEELK